MTNATRWPLTGVAVALCLVGARAALALDAVCGLTVPAGETAVLQADLTCATDPVAITLDAASTLDLNGFTLRVSADGAAGVVCVDRACSVVSSAAAPGIISGESTAEYGIFIREDIAAGEAPLTSMVVNNVSVRDFKEIGIYATGRGTTTLTNVNVSGCGFEGVNGGQHGRLVVNSVVVNDNADGIVGPHSVKGIGLTLNANSGRAMSNVKRVNLTGLTASGNGIAGLEVGALGLLDSALSGNGQFDVGSVRRPRLRNSTCERSRKLPPAFGTWGVCTLDQ
jgi:hypothetical protein